MVGDQVADARAKVGVLQVRAADLQPALRRRGVWRCGRTRYAPAVAPWNEESGADGFLSHTGAAHLFGGEEGTLIADLAHRLDRFGLRPGSLSPIRPERPWAFPASTFTGPLSCPTEQEDAAPCSLPPSRLRLSPRQHNDPHARRLGSSASARCSQPACPFAARFPAERLCTVSTSALGRAPEPLDPDRATRSTAACASFSSLSAAGAIVEVAIRSMRISCLRWSAMDIGALGPLRLATLTRRGRMVATVDMASRCRRASPRTSRVSSIQARTNRRDHRCRFGFEALGLAVTVAEAWSRSRPSLLPLAMATEWKLRGGDSDSLRQRLGSRRVRRLGPVASHLPERAETPRPVVRSPLLAGRRTNTAASHFSAASCAEPVEVVASARSPPKRFRWLA